MKFTDLKSQCFKASVWDTAASNLILLTLLLITFYLGESLGDMSCGKIVNNLCLLGIFLGFLSVICNFRRDGKYAIDRWGVCLLIYTCTAIGLELPWGGSTFGVILSVALLTPIIVGAVGLPHRGYWFAGLGCWCVLFACSVGLAYTCTHIGWVSYSLLRVFESF